MYDTEITRIAIQQDIGRSEVSRYNYRLHGCCRGPLVNLCREVADLFVEDRTTIRSWLRRFKEEVLMPCAKVSERVLMT
ncbi:MAG: hypothetical protein M3O26_15925 [Pseudomonadota bacterium]|nr:hypothetical protein [Pseudomonadota bacterium]